MFFVISEEHLVVRADIDTDIDRIGKLEKFRNRITTNHTVEQFNSPVDLRAKVINSLSKLSINKGAKSLNITYSVPEYPNPYFAHTYTLLGETGFIGRKQELEELSRWNQKVFSNDFTDRIYVLHAIGGMGKSAITWNWVRNEFVNSTQRNIGLIWWSFYESDASFSNFTIKALEYLYGWSSSTANELSPDKRIDELLRVLETKKCLIVFDGIERILNAYNKLDSASINEDNLDVKSGNKLTGEQFSLSNLTNKKFKTERRLRQPIDPKLTLFFVKLLNIPNFSSRVLVTTRLVPTIFENKMGCNIKELVGLKDEDALELWEQYNSRNNDKNNLLRLFNRVNNYPLLIRALATEVANFRSSPGNFDDWKLKNPNFDPFGIPLNNVKSHVLEYALKGISNNASMVLKIIAAFRSPIDYSTIKVLVDKKVKLSESSLDILLSHLEDRGLIGWNRINNTYDLHPIVRGVVWNITNKKDKINVFETLESHFRRVPLSLEWQKINDESELKIPIEHFYTLIELNKFEQAYEIFTERLNKPIHYSLGNSNLRIQLLECLFTNSLQCHINNDFSEIFLLNSLCTSFDLLGKMESAQKLYHKQIKLLEKIRDYSNLYIAYINFSESLLSSGNAFEAEKYARKAIWNIQKYYDPYNECISLLKTSKIFFTLGLLDETKSLQYRSKVLAKRIKDDRLILLSNIMATSLNSKTNAKNISEFERLLGNLYNSIHIRDRITINRIIAELYAQNKNYYKAIDILDQLLITVRKIEWLEEESLVLQLLGKYNIYLKDFGNAKSHIEASIEISKECEFRKLLCDGYFLLSTIYEYEGETKMKEKYNAKSLEFAKFKHVYFYAEGLNRLNVGEKISDINSLFRKKFPINVSVTRQKRLI